jgi:hypothetical protein
MFKVQSVIKTIIVARARDFEKLKICGLILTEEVSRADTVIIRDKLILKPLCF